MMKYDKDESVVDLTARSVEFMETKVYDGESYQDVPIWKYINKAL